MTRTRIYLLAAASVLAVAACNSTSGSNASDESGSVVVTAQKSDAAGRARNMPPPPPPAPLAMASPAFGAIASPPPLGYAQPLLGDIDRDKYEDVELNSVKVVAEEPVSTFSIDVDTASYSNVRRFLNDGVLPPKDAVRIEELVNYFDYDYPLPKSETTPFSTTVKVVPSPWADGRQIMHVGVQGYDIKATDRPPLNLTLLVDVSGSMSSPDKLPLAVKALKMLVDKLDSDDHVAIVVYAGAAGAVLEPTSGDQKGKIIAALEQLNAGGSTAGGEGLRLAYSLARQSYDKDAVNRVMLMTDGDFNVGISDPERLEDFVSRERETGVYLSVLGFGRGNYNDAMMQKLAQTGNGVAAYVDTLNEARKLFSDDLASSMFTIADDVKIQVEFNPQRVAEYRLIGYETRLLKREDFNNDKVDAGEVGSGASVTALYEITPVGSSARLMPESRYQQPEKVAADLSGEYAYLKLRYKPPGEDASKLIERPVTNKDAVSSIDDAPESTRFALAVAGFGQLLRGDPFLDKSFTWDKVISLANGAKGSDAYGYRAEFVQLARLAETAASQAALPRPSTGGQ
ncbi:MAG: VWA domain-containing protein [Hyphomonadaceae bacterium]